MSSLMLYKISDSTGSTLDVVVRACLVQFSDAKIHEKRWTMVRTKNCVKKLLTAICENPGFVIFTFVDNELTEQLVLGCKKLNVPCIDLLNPVLAQLGNYLGLQQSARPGSQHVMDADYFSKIEALHYAHAHDDGQSLYDINEADIVLVGVSRTTKTPASIYLANLGMKVANVPVVPGMSIPQELIVVDHPLIIGMTKKPRHLIQIRRNRLKIQGHTEETDYVDLTAVRKEIQDAKRQYKKLNWPIIDVTQKSIEETSAIILKMYNERLDYVL